MAANRSIEIEWEASVVSFVAQQVGDGECLELLCAERLQVSFNNVGDKLFARPCAQSVASRILIEPPIDEQTEGLDCDALIVPLFTQLLFSFLLKLQASGSVFFMFKSCSQARDFL